MTVNAAKVQVLIRVPVDFSLDGAAGYVGDIVSMVFDRGARDWIAHGTQPHNGYFLANRAIRTTYPELMDVLARYPELPFDVLQAQSFSLVSTTETVDGEEVTTSAPEVYRQASEADILPYMADVVEHDAEGNEISRSRPETVTLQPPVMGGSGWVFGDGSGVVDLSLSLQV